MRRMSIILLILLVIAAGGCGNRNEVNTSDQVTTSIQEKEDGTIILNINEAYLLQDSLHPDMNTAEWSFNVQHRGRYELWLTSFTKDTMDLRYESPVIVNFCDKRIKAKPIGNEIILDTPGTGDFYYRADSKLGSVYIDKPGDYNIQVVSDKVRPARNYLDRKDASHTQLRSLVLKPMTE